MGCGSSALPTPAPTPAQQQQQQGYKEFDYQCKLLLLGDSSVGKSALMLRFADDTFKGSFISTVGIDFKMKTMVVDGKKVKIQIWDTAGQERFRTITKTYYRGAHGYILVYDITSKESFEHVKYWLSEVKKNGNDDVPKVIVGNKADLDDQRLVTSEELAAFADERRIPYCETSAKDGTNVNDLFVDLTKAFLKIADTLPGVQSPPTSPSSK